MSESVELLPCPFCGAPGRLMDYKIAGFEVVCTSCNASTHTDGVTDDAKSNIAAWNRRAPSEALSTAERRGAERMRTTCAGVVDALAAGMKTADRFLKPEGVEQLAEAIRNLGVE